MGVPWTQVSSRTAKGVGDSDLSATGNGRNDVAVVTLVFDKITKFMVYIRIVNDSKFKEYLLVSIGHWAVDAMLR